MKHNVEILAPAGSMTSLQASFKAGADAVYMGGLRFGARAYAKNPDTDNLRRAIDYAHLRGKRLYLTVNTLIKENEIWDLPEFLTPYYEEGLDAVLVQDLGALRVIEECFPKLPIHLSTQMSITDASEISFMSDRVTRIVPARELNLEDIRRLKKETGKEIEVFVHGALCYSYSGQCLFSSMCGDRSGNRGRCAQPCRKKYFFNGEESYLLSPKDICTLDNLPDLIEAGVDSFKIEGRMKSPEYAAGVSNAYSNALKLYNAEGREGFYKYIDTHKEQWEDVHTGLLDLFNRGGFSKGYAFSRPGPEMMYTRRPNHEGVFVGTAVITGGRVSFKPVVKLFKGDVLEVRSNLIKNWFSYTLPEAVRGNVSFKVNTKEDNRRTEGRKVEIYRLRSEKTLTEIGEKFVNVADSVPVTGELYAEPGAPMVMTVRTACANALTGQNYEAVVTGETVDFAKSQAAEEEDIVKKLSRSADSEFEFKDLEVTLNGNCFIPKSWLGQIRRDALAALEQEIKEDFKRSPGKNCPAENSTQVEPINNSEYSPLTHVRVFNRNQLEAVLKSGRADAVVIDCLTQLLDVLPQLGAELGHMPVYVRIMRVGADINRREGLKNRLKKNLLELLEAGINLVGFYGAGNGAFDFVAQLEQEVGRSFEIITDSNVYVANHFAAEELAEAGAEGLTLSHELTANETKKLMEGIRQNTNLKTVLTVYGREELMISAQCIKKTTGNCNRTEEWFEISTYEHVSYPVHSFCRNDCNIIYDSEPVNLMTAETLAEVEEIGADVVAYAFTDETPEEVEKVLSGKALNPGKTGHFKRSVL